MARRGRSLLNALKSTGRRDVRDKKLKSIRAQYWGTEGTKDYRLARRRFNKGASETNQEYNTRMHLMQGDPGKERKDPRLRRARRCMERAMLSGQSGKNAFSGCGMSYGTTGNLGDYRVGRGRHKRRGVLFDDDTY
jgi:hypothetical protein